jgi:hypothetical protein
MSSLLPIELVTKKILIIRGTKVLLDRDLALLYGVKPIALRQQVKRNIGRFPKDFMFQLTLEEADYLVSQNVIPSKRSYGGSLPYVFSEQGVAMLSSVLRSEMAIKTNILIMRAFVQLRALFSENEILKYALDGLRQQVSINSQNIQRAFDVIENILEPKTKENKNRKMGFHKPEK